MKTRTLPIVVAAVLSALLAACTPAQSTLFAKDAPAAVAAVSLPRIEVLSGDTIVVDGRHVRLADMTAPQAAPYAHCAAEALGARQARLRIAALSQGVQTVTVTPTGSVDSRNRTLATVYLDGVVVCRVTVGVAGAWACSE